MITEKEYLQALEVCKQYKQQFEDEIKFSPRLFNALEFGLKIDVNRIYNRDFEQLKNFNFDKFIKIKNVGKKSCQELEIFLTKYNIKYINTCFNY